MDHAHYRQLVDLMKRNIEHNKVEKNVFPAELNWGEEINEAPKEVDIVLAADCVYFEVSDRYGQY